MKTNPGSLRHTPGPWSVAPNGCCVFTDLLVEGRGIAMCSMNARTPEEITANTRLIAAAPDLLYVATLVAELGSVLGMNNAVVQLARSAIAKAEGTEPVEVPASDPNEKKARLFYYEEAMSCWTPAPDCVEDLISLDQFSDEEERIEIEFKRCDLSDKEMDELPEV